VLVTGGTGHLGGHLVRRLAALGARVYVLARARSAPHRVAGVAGVAKILTGDIRSRRDVIRAVAAAEPEVIFHLAAHGVNPRMRNPSTIIATNVVGTVNLLDAARAVPYSRLVNTGTCFEYGNRRAPIAESCPLEPLNVYAASKSMALYLCGLDAKRHGKPIVTIRPFTFFGPGEGPDRLIPSVIRAILAGRPIRITAGRQTRDYTYVEDMAAAFVSAAVVPAAVGRVINVGTGEDRPVREIAERIRRILKADVPLEVGALAARADDAWRLCADNALARTLLGWRPRVSFAEGIRRTADWLRRAG
jgi:nucleoside-diphosphate-sugar epimerase